jgi:hypothetical protein
VADDNESRTQRPKPRKVSPAAADTSDVTEAIEPTEAGDGASSEVRRPRRTRPFWRRGSFWVGVIVAEVAIALVVSVAFERSTTEVDLSGGDLAAFCEQARTLQAEGEAAGSANVENGSVGDAAVFERERDISLALVATAPPALVADLERLAEQDGELARVVREIGEKKAADPGYDGSAALTRALEQARTRGRVASARLELVLREQCGMDPASGVTTTAVDVTPTTPVRDAPVPGTSPS